MVKIFSQTKYIESVKLINWKKSTFSFLNFKMPRHLQFTVMDVQWGICSVTCMWRLCVCFCVCLLLF